MLTYKDFFTQSRTLIVLGLPIFLGQFAQMSMGFVDTVMAGRHSTDAMAGVGVGGAFWVPILLFAQGLLNCITPLVSQSIGQNKDEKEINSYWRQGFWLALFSCISLFLLLILASELVLAQKNIDPALALVTSDYISYIKWGLPAFCFLYICRFHLEGMGITRPSMVAGIAALVFNIPLNYMFIFGKFGMPELGGAGCGLASAIVCWVMAFVLFAYLLHHSPSTMAFAMPNWKKIRRMFRIGIPVAFAQLLEVSSFTIIAFLIAPLGSIVVAGHQAALNVSSLIFMSPLSLGIATTIRTAHCLGAQKYEEAILVRKTSMLLALICSVLAFIFLLVLREKIAYLYSHDPAVVESAKYILIFTALYQIVDWLQIVSLSTLRAYNDTKFIFFSGLISYWGVSLPVGYVLCFYHIMGQLGVIGFWIGIILGLTLAFFVLLIRVLYLEKKSNAFLLQKIVQ